MPSKRSLSPSATHSIRSPKRVHAVPDDEEESLEDILARIKQQEDSERLAKQLHEQWNGSVTNESSSHAHRPGTSSQAAIVIDDSFESDEALAHRLAAEWDQGADADNDVVFVGSSAPLPAARVIAAESSVSKVNKDKGKTRASQPIPPSQPAQEQPPVDETLAIHRELFTKSRNCTKCGKSIQSPRGLVCIGYLRRTDPLNNCV